LFPRRRVGSFILLRYLPTNNQSQGSTVIFENWIEPRVRGKLHQIERYVICRFFMSRVLLRCVLLSDIWLIYMGGYLVVILVDNSLIYNVHWSAMSSRWYLVVVGMQCFFVDIS
jgi:hypothetical protein